MVCHARIVGFALTALLGAPSADARTWYVTPNGSGDAPTINVALDSATAGDVVLLAPGTYSLTSEGVIPQPPNFGMIRILKQITLRSEGGPDVTVLDAERQARVIYCENAGEVRLEGLTLTRGVADGSLSGAGCFADATTRPSISNCIIRDCDSGGNGGGISCTNAVITDCVVRACVSSDGWGGGIFCENSIITNCQILLNRVFRGRRGAGIYGRGTVIRDCLIRDNRASGVGGTYGGGIFADAGGEIVNCWILGNSVNDRTVGGGGGVFAGLLPVRNCVFVNNTVLSETSLRRPRGGGAMAWGEVSDCVFVGNRVISDGGLSAEGGAVYGELASFSMTRCTLVANSAIGGASPVGGVFTLATSAVTSTIIAWNQGLPCGGSPVLTCCNLFGNSLGDALCASDGGDNFSADPQFCASDPATSLNFTLQEDSPCAPGRHPSGATCGTIGDEGIGCGEVSIERRTWSSLKAMYR